MKILMGVALFSFYSLSAHAGHFFKIPKFQESLIKIGSTKDGELDPNSIKLLVWNMYKGQNADYEADFLTMSEDRDILLLQEAYMSEKMKRTFLESGFGYKFAISFLYHQKNDTATGVAMGSHIEPHDTFFQRSPLREIFGWTPKMTIFNKFKVRGQREELLTASIHAINVVPKFMLVSQLKGVEEVFKKHHGAALLAGDFNTWSKAKLKYLRKMAARLGMTEVQFRNDQRMQVMGNFIDYVFVKGLEVVDAEVHGESKGSDHKALAVEVRYPSH